MMTFAEKERECERVFDADGPFWHVYTDGSAVADIFVDDEQMREAMIALAVCAVLFKKAELVTFELMSNHVHLIMRGEREDCLEFFRMFKKRLVRHSMATDIIIDWNKFEPQILGIATVKDLRNEIIYTNRNAYVANRRYTPFNYPWGGGWAYFTPVIGLLSTTNISEMGARKLRELTHYRNVEELASLRFIGDVPFIPSFCRVDIGESVFQDARSYFHALTRNAESFSQVAERLKDSVFLTDDEMFVVAAKNAQEMFSRKLGLLTSDQKTQLAGKLHYEYKASNRQIRRILNLDLTLLDEMFPVGR
jgi:REP element-mobilizing transposase RayT